MEENYRGFYDDLKEDISRYTGEHKSLLENCPKFFKLLCDILKDKRADWHTRLLVNSALAYFVLPEDVIPDYDERGYIDDLFLTAFVLVEIKNNVDEHLLIDNWNQDGNILELVEDVHDRSKIIIGEDYIDVLRLVGLRKYVSLDLNEYSGDYPSKIARLADDKRELLGLLSFVVSKLYGVSRTRELEKVKEFLMEHEDFDEIERILYIAKDRKNDFHKTKKKNVQKEESSSNDLRERRIERLLNGYKND